MDANPKEGSISILMLPWLAHGHISPFFELAKRLSLRNLKVYFCSTPINLKPIRENYLHDSFPLIELIDLQLPSSFLETLPPQYHTTKNLPPHLMATLKTAFDEARPAYCSLLKALKPNLVIYDFLQPWESQSANEMKIKAVVFLTSSAASCAFLAHFCMYPSSEFPLQEFSFPESERQKMTEFMHHVANGVTNKDRYLKCLERSSNMILIKTSREIEAKYVDYYSGLLGKELITVGTLAQEPAAYNDTNHDAYILNWLSKREVGSVVYVSFGSEYFLSKEEIEEIAYGLELSKVSFVWVVRFPGGDDQQKIMKTNEGLPLGFLERVEDRGLVVEGWAPQAKILRSSCLGGFVSHCGWSSTLEGITFGVPIIAMPMHLDQPLNARLVVDIEVGLEVPRKDGRIDGEEMAKVINQVLVGEGGQEIRERAIELSRKLRERGEEDMDLAVKKLVQFVNVGI